MEVDEAPADANGSAAEVRSSCPPSLMLSWRLRARTLQLYAWSRGSLQGAAGQAEDDTGQTRGISHDSVAPHTRPVIARYNPRTL